ncbi:hypothetical protein VTL71DRAFT_1109 [Oculimacula yallundae]|uniref:Uncharacterized protein n=1 Tax=Oculimacula yallundae TaxID=86028 RepID=A0ABR4D1X3_9HELO
MNYSTTDSNMHSSIVWTVFYSRGRPPDKSSSSRVTAEPRPSQAREPDRSLIFLRPSVITLLVDALDEETLGVLGYVPDTDLCQRSDI